MFLNKWFNSCDNIYERVSQFLSYYYGDSTFFSIDNIHFYNKFYHYFPIYLNYMDKISWDSYKECLRLRQDECYFYYRITLFCGDNTKELVQLINSKLFSRI